MSSITEKVHDDATLRDSLVNLEEVGSGDPAILDGLLPGCTVLSDTNDDIQAIVTEIETLAMALRSVADQGKSIVLEVVLLWSKSN